MIEELKYINNVGRFASFEGTADTALKKVSLIYSENGRGKTTLCSILSSMTTGDPSPILERRRASATAAPHVAIQSDGTTISFDGTKWTAPGPTVLVFDEQFTDTNVHSGLGVTPGHRQNLHGLVIGEAGVSHARQVEDLGKQIDKLNGTLRENECAFSPQTLGSFSVADFCELPQLEDIDTRISETKQSVALLRDGQKVSTTAEFKPLGLPLSPKKLSISLGLDSPKSRLLPWRLCRHTSAISEKVARRGFPRAWGF